MNGRQAARFRNNEIEIGTHKNEESIPQKWKLNTQREREHSTKEESFAFTRFCRFFFFIAPFVGGKNDGHSPWLHYVGRESLNRVCNNPQTGKIQVKTASQRG